MSFVLLALYLVSVCCLLRVCSFHLDLSLPASIVACCLFLLNGFALANLYTAMAQPYFIAPILLLSLMVVTERVTPVTVAAAIGAHVLFTATSFLQTAMLCGIIVYLVVLSRRIWQNPRRWRRLLLLCTGVSLTSIALLSFLYVPAIALYFTFLNNSLAQYQARLTPGIRFINLLSVFSPKHFWEFYRAMRIPLLNSGGVYAWEVPFVGIVGPLLAIHAFTRLRRSSFIVYQYWSCLLVFAMAFLAAYGYDAINWDNAFTYPCFFLIAVMSCAFFYLYGHEGIPADVATRRYLFVFWCLIGACSALLWACRFEGGRRWGKPALLVLLLCEGLFYMNGLRPYRSLRDQHLPESIAWVKAEIDRHPGSRILNIGMSGVVPAWGSALQIPQLGDINIGIPSWYEYFFNHYIGNGLFLSLIGPQNTFLFTDPALSLAGVRYVIVDRTFDKAVQRISRLGYAPVRQDSIRIVFENPHPLPRTFPVSAVAVSEGLPFDHGMGIDTSITTTDTHLVGEARALGITVKTSPGPSVIPGELKVTGYHHTRVSIRCSMSRPGLVVLTDTWTPWWRAELDGRPIYVGRADIAFRAVAVPAGNHEIVFTYTSLPLTIGKLASLLTVVLLLIFFWFWMRRSRLISVRSSSRALESEVAHAAR